MCVREHLLCVHDLPYDVLPHLSALKSLHLLFFPAFVLHFNACHPGNLYKPVTHPKKNSKIIAELAFSVLITDHFIPVKNKQTQKEEIILLQCLLDACPVQVYHPGSLPKIWIPHIALPPAVTSLCVFSLSVLSHNF